MNYGLVECLLYYNLIKLSGENNRVVLFNNFINRNRQL